MFQRFSKKTADQLPALKDIHAWNMTYDYVIDDYKQRFQDSISEVEEAGMATGFDKYRYSSIIGVYRSKGVNSYTQP